MPEVAPAVIVPKSALVDTQRVFRPPMESRQSRAIAAVKLQAILFS
jgi:hypothetical protein